MSATTGQGPRPVRVAFATPVATSDELRTVLIAMVKEARARLSTGPEAHGR
jgi:putative heme iron utilization protein